MREQSGVSQSLQEAQRPQTPISSQRKLEDEEPLCFTQLGLTFSFHTEKNRRINVKLMSVEPWERKCCYLAWVILMSVSGLEQDHTIVHKKMVNIFYLGLEFYRTRERVNMVFS